MSPTSPVLKPLIVTMGDPAGIGPELALKTWLEKDRAQLPPFVYLGDPEDLMHRADAAGITVPVEIITGTLVENLIDFNRVLPVIPLRLVQPSIAGHPDAANAPQVIESISRSVDLLRREAARALVTNPIQKSCLYEAGFEFPGHTEYLAHLADQWPSRRGGQPVRPVMMLASDELKVIPATIHIALKDVPSKLTTALLVETALVAARDLEDRFGIPAPRIAFSGLNPHAGEAGAMGDEEETIILPAIRHLVAEGINASGPFPADTLFHEAARQRYDVVIAMYHDQALVPVKTIAFDRAVNVTLGLPFVRTSPDHGTALDIAGTGQANPSSLIAAIKMADIMSRTSST
ncbi:MAG: 4-hydroxythreonine-4-phosphate dehydrogenase PdxA [Fimbriimonadaceae bacterium]|nr:4-hydroxythreonine-4-phosphate dehydrogenase PdxA [Alphaproteobacteria bacterium]